MIYKLKGKVNPGMLKIAREYRGLNQTELCKKVKGLSQPNLSRFEKGQWGAISELKLREVMDVLDWPFEFLYHKGMVNFKSSLDF